MPNGTSSAHEPATTYTSSPATPHSARDRSIPNDSSRLRTRNASELTPSANISALATVASSTSNALNRFTGTLTAHRNSAATNARRLPRRSPQAVTSNSEPASRVNVRLESSTSVGTRRSSATSRSGGWESSAESRSIQPITATASDSTTRRTVWERGGRLGGGGSAAPGTDRTPRDPGDTGVATGETVRSTARMDLLRRRLLRRRHHHQRIQLRELLLGDDVLRLELAAALERTRGDDLVRGRVVHARELHEVFLARRVEVRLRVRRLARAVRRMMRRRGALWRRGRVGGGSERRGERRRRD